MLGIRRTETPKASIMKFVFRGDIPYVVAVLSFCRCRLTGVGVAEPEKVAFQALSLMGLTTLLRLPPEHVMTASRICSVVTFSIL